MLSKCLNPQCSSTFQYLNQGRLFRVDFSEASKKSALAGRPIVASTRSLTHPLEHFWLCQDCAATMTLTLNDAGVVRLASLEVSALTNAEPTLPAPKPRETAALVRQLPIFSTTNACV